MALLINTAEGGTSGISVSPANSGGASGTAFSGVNIGSGATLVYDNTQAAHGSKSIHIITPLNVLDTVTMTGPAANSYATRMYIRFNTLPGSLVQRFIAVPAAAGFAIGGANQFGIRDSSSTVKTFTATTIAVGVWYRLELEVTRGTTTTNGYVAGRYFVGDSTTPAETAYSSSAVNTGTVGTLPAVNFGAITPITAQTYDFWIDDLAISDGTTTPIGPAAVAATGTAAMALAATATAVPAAVFAGWGIPL